MASILLSFAEGVSSQLGELAVPYIQYVFCLKNEKTKLMNTLSTIKASLTVLEKLEKQRELNVSEKEWIEKLHDVLYDADDLMDDFATEALRKQLEMIESNFVEKVLHFFSAVGFYVVMACRIKAIRDRLDDMAADRSKFGTSAQGESPPARKGETHSFVLETNVIGRDEDKKAIIEKLMDSGNPDNVSFIPIIGIGGVGKTTLAQLVYTDEQVTKQFELKMWVCISESFDVKLIVKRIIKSANPGQKCDDFDLDALQTLLREKINGKKYLLILDDIWNEDREKWRELRDLLMGGARGSKIIITTRMELVATITGAVQPYVLKALSDDKSWSIFRQTAFKPLQELENPDLVLIGKEIVRKCAGIPLAIRTLGSLLYSKDTENEWKDFKNNELSQILAQNENVSNVLQILKLSYDHLPSHLQRCFAYCSLFLKDYEINKSTLISLWIAQGFIQSSSKTQSLEDIGDQYFMDLCRRSFFQDVIEDIVENTTVCKMHDLFHDLAESVVGIEISRINLDTENVIERTRHLSFPFPLESSWEIPKGLLNPKKLRTFLLLTWTDRMSFSTCGIIFSSFRCLRALDLHGLGIQKVPSSIGELNHLRYVDLSGNDFEILPKSMTRLQNLQTLKLNWCSNLKEFPRGIRKLVSLRHLEIEACDSLTHMPSGLGQLTCLQTLSRFVVGDQDSSNKYGLVGGLSELKSLINLRGDLSISIKKGSKSVTTKAEEEANSYLKGLQYLQSLYLYWD